MKVLLEVPRTFSDWNEVYVTYLGSCHCISLITDMETYLELEALEQECLDELLQKFVELGLRYCA